MLPLIIQPDDKCRLKPDLFCGDTTRYDLSYYIFMVAGADTAWELIEK